MLKTLEQYLRDAIAKGQIDFKIRAEIPEGKPPRFYIHPDGTDGETLDYEVSGESITCVSQFLPK